MNKISILYSSTNEISAQMGQIFFENDMRSAHETKIETDNFRQKAALIQSIRENAAVEATKQAAQAHYKKVEEASIAILVYGAMHDFQPLCTTNGLYYQKIYTNPLQVEKYGKNSRYESSYIPGSLHWNTLDICEISNLDIDKINKQGSVEFFPQKIKILASLILIAAGSGLLAMYFLLTVANPLVLLISGVLLMGIGLSIGLYLFAEYLKDRHSPPPATLGVVIKDEESTAIQQPTYLNPRPTTLSRGTLFSAVDDQFTRVSEPNQSNLDGLHC